MKKHFEVVLAKIAWIAVEAETAEQAEKIAKEKYREEWFEEDDDPQPYYKTDEIGQDDYDEHNHKL